MMQDSSMSDIYNIRIPLPSVIIKPWSFRSHCEVHCFWLPYIYL